MDEHIDIYEYIENVFNDKFKQTYTMQPATIEKYNDNNTVNMRLDSEDFLLKDIPLSILGDKNSYITTPTMHTGTKGLLIFSKHDLRDWLSDGTDKDANSDFSKNNGFFLLGATWEKNRITYNHDAIEIKTNKAIEISSQNDTSIDSAKNVKIKAQADITNDAANIKSIAQADITNDAVNIIQTATENLTQNAKIINGVAQTAITYTAPAISITSSTTGEELFTLLGQALDTVKTMANELTKARDTADNSLLTNSAAFAAIEQEATILSQKFKGFKNV